MDHYHSQEQANEKRLIHNSLSLTLETLEVYIEKNGWYPDFHNRRQIRYKGLPNENEDAWVYKNATVTQILILPIILGKMPSPIVRDYVHKEFYSWIDYANINVTNCPKDLVLLLINIDKALVGDSKKIMNDTGTDTFLIKDKEESKPESVIILFGSIQEVAHDNKKQLEFLENKKFEEVKIPEIKEDTFLKDKEEPKLESIISLFDSIQEVADDNKKQLEFKKFEKIEIPEIKEDTFLKDKKEPKPESIISLFDSIQEDADDNKKQLEFLENKKFELEIPRFKGDWEKGKEKFEAIKAMYYHEQQETQPGGSMKIEYQSLK